MTYNSTQKTNQKTTLATNKSNSVNMSPGQSSECFDENIAEHYLHTGTKH